MSWPRKVVSLGLILLFSALGVHFHPAETLSHSHFHDLTVTVTNHSPAHILTDGHVCPCFVATLDMPMLPTQYMVTLSEASLPGPFLFNPLPPLTWEIFHPPQAV